MHPSTQELLNRLETGTADFAATLSHIDARYTFTPTAFRHGAVQNAAGQNSGACRVFAFAQVENLNKAQTLALFAEHYRAVLDNPDDDNHGNIRQFMCTDSAGLVFEGRALQAKG